MDFVGTVIKTCGATMKRRFGKMRIFSENIFIELLITVRPGLHYQFMYLTKNYSGVLKNILESFLLLSRLGIV